MSKELKMAMEFRNLYDEFLNENTLADMDEAIKKAKELGYFGVVETIEMMKKIKAELSSKDYFIGRNYYVK